MNILVVEDNDVLASGLRDGLRCFGHGVTIAETAAAALLALARQRFDTLLLDLGLPDMDGLDLLAKVRSAQTELLIIIVSARDSMPDRERGLSLGADDYLIKPVGLADLDTRIRKLSARRAATASLRNGPLELDTAARAARLAGEPLELGGGELAILEMLLRNAGQLLRKEKLLASMGNYDDSVAAGALDSVIGRLRGKLGPAMQIKTVRGYGYLLSAEK